MRSFSNRHTQAGLGHDRDDADTARHAVRLNFFRTSDPAGAPPGGTPRRKTSGRVFHDCGGSRARRASRRSTRHDGAEAGRSRRNEGRVIGGRAEELLACRLDAHNLVSNLVGEDLCQQRKTQFVVVPVTTLLPDQFLTTESSIFWW